MNRELRNVMLGGLLAVLVAALVWAADEAVTGDAADAGSEAQPNARVLDAPADEAQDDALPEFDQAAIVAAQRARLGEVKQKLQLLLVAAESDHFLVFSDLDSRVRGAILIWLEDLRTKLIDQLGVDPKERLWDGKCLVLVFARQDFLAKYAREFDHHDTKRPRGYFVLEARRSRNPRLVHIAAFQPLEGGNPALREVLVHETTHAIIELYKKSAGLPLWLHEGLAEYMTVVMDPSLRPRKQAGAFGVATAQPYVSIRDLFRCSFPASDVAAYSCSMGLVECLQGIDPRGVLRFVELLKEGAEPEAALGRAYPGVDYAELERLWRRFVMQSYRPPAGDEHRR